MRLSLSVLVCTSMAACAPNPQSAGQASRVAPREFDKQVVFKDPDFARALRITKVDSERMANGLLRARVQVFSLVRDDVVGQLQWKFRDEKGFDIHTTSRDAHVFKGAQTETLERVSLNDKPIDWVLLIEK